MCGSAVVVVAGVVVALPLPLAMNGIDCVSVYRHDVFDPMGLLDLWVVSVELFHQWQNAVVDDGWLHRVWNPFNQSIYID